MKKSALAMVGTLVGCLLLSVISVITYSQDRSGNVIQAPPAV